MTVPLRCCIMHQIIHRVNERCRKIQCDFVSVKAVDECIKMNALE